MRLAIVLALSLASSTAASRAAAQDVIDLGGGASVRRASAPCPLDPSILCAWWVPQGISFELHPELEQAAAFARAPSGRVFGMISASTPSLSRYVSQPYPIGATLLYTDDRGATWRQAVWPDAHAHALAFAFDPGTGAAVAVGTGGGIWTSDDGGASWRERRSTTGTLYTGVWIRGRTIVVQDSRGALWMSRDRGFALESLAPRGTVREEGGEIVVTLERGGRRIDRHGDVDRL